MRQEIRGVMAASAAGIAVLAAGCFTDALDEGSTEQAALVPTTWTNTVGVDAVGNDLTKTGPTGWNAGASSVESIATDGAVEFTTGENDHAKMVGLSNGDTDQNYTDIDFAVFLTSIGKVQIYEGGVLRGTFGTYVASDLFRIEVADGVVRYSRNGVVFYTSLGTPTFPLIVDTSLNQTGGTVLDVVLGQDFWQNDVGVSIDGNSLTKTAATGWNAGASTVRTLTSDGAVEFTTGEANRGKMAGLSNGDTNRNYTDIDFAVFLSSTGKVQVYEAGVLRGTFGSYVAGDVFRVAVNAGVVRYYRNGALFYTSSGTPTFPLLVDTSLNQTGATIQNVVFAPTFWQNAVGVLVTDNSLTKTAPTGWCSSGCNRNAGASTTQQIQGDGYAEFTTAENNFAKMAGLSETDLDQYYTEIDYAVFLASTGAVQVRENGVQRGTFGTYVAGDVFRIEVASGVVRYYRNGILLYTSLVAPASSLLFDTSLRDMGATVQDVTLVEAP